MKSKAFLLFVCLFFLLPTANALELAGFTSLHAGQSKIKLAAGYISNILSPNATFTHLTNSNSAKLYEESLIYSIGLGDHLLKEMYIETEVKAFQSGKETLNGVTVHDRDRGAGVTLRVGGNFYHTLKFKAGGWIQGGIPVFIDENKFVNPVYDYIGGGLNLIYSFTKTIGISQTMYLGSGLFNPRKRNEHIQTATLPNFNVGQWFFGKDLVFSSGIVIESDLTSRIDQAYQSSSLGDGRIKNTVFISPFLLNLPIGNHWAIEGGYATKWYGRSVRGSRFVTAAISTKF
jgi:hypothetical protein